MAITKPKSKTKRGRPHTHKDKDKDKTKKPTAEAVERLQKVSLSLEELEHNLQPHTPTDPDMIAMMHEFEKVRLYLFNFVQQLVEIREMIGQIKGLISQGQGQAVFRAMPAFQIPSVFSADKNDYIKKNMAQILKHMVPKGAMDMLPREVQEAYHNILSSMAPPNDPIWNPDSQKPDPREPVGVDLDGELYDTPEGKENEAEEQEQEQEQEQSEEPSEREAGTG